MASLSILLKRMKFLPLKSAQGQRRQAEPRFCRRSHGLAPTRRLHPLPPPRPRVRGRGWRGELSSGPRAVTLRMPRPALQHFIFSTFFCKGFIVCSDFFFCIFLFPSFDTLRWIYNVGDPITAYVYWLYIY
jgi:hypothetical protein